ncbi:MAG: SAM-dependent methyltransferase [Dehalococcoidia bacterium]|nr:SAM-dependent methyltransferase [Dehalococcoidia bacterium]
MSRATGPVSPISEVEAVIREAIRREGRITFARYMELALFSAPGGYYSTLRQAKAEGRYRDYFTAPMAHPLFGRLLAHQLQEVWESLGRPDPFWIVEPGCGDGLLARDILAGMERVTPDCLSATRYVLADRTAPVSGFLQPVLRHTERMATDRLPFRGVVGCVLSNELLDAFPVHRFQAQGGRLMEVYVALDGDRFAEWLEEPSSPRLTERLAAIQSATGGLPDGVRGEVCLEMEDWVADVARGLARGVVLTIDYGYTTQALGGLAMRAGTLRCYFRHTVGGNPYVRPGRQDITAHVDFGALMACGEQAGLATLGYATQDAFLRNLGADLYLEALHAQRLPDSELAANRMGMLELVRPEGMGNFKVLAQGKGLGAAQLSGFHESNPVREQLAAHAGELPVPLLTPEHAPLLAARYPHAAQATGRDDLR